MKGTNVLAHDLIIRPATPSDAEFMAQLVNQASEGLSQATWAYLAQEGQSPLDVGLARIRSTDSWIGWQNGWIAEANKVHAGVLVTYLHGEAMPGPDAETLPGFVPPLELEAMAPNSRYLLIVSTMAEFQGKGVGTALLAHAETMDGPGRLSLIVSNGNHLAAKLYERVGYRAVARRPIVCIPGWNSSGTDWVLMIKDVAQAKPGGKKRGQSSLPPPWSERGPAASGKSGAGCSL